VYNVRSKFRKSPSVGLEVIRLDSQTWIASLCEISKHAMYASLLLHDIPLRSLCCDLESSEKERICCLT
jgi:hypothetical protein